MAAAPSYATHAGKVYDDGTKRAAYRDLVAVAKPLIEAENKGAQPQDEDTIAAITTGEMMMVKFSPARADPPAMRDAIESDLAHMGASVYLKVDEAKGEAAVVVQISLTAYVADLAAKNAQQAPRPVNVLLWVIVVVLGLVGLAAFFFIPYKTKEKIGRALFGLIGSRIGGGGNGPRNEL